MTETELELKKLRWRVQMLEQLSISLFASLTYSVNRVPASEFARVTMQILDSVSSAGETLLLSEEVPEEQRVLLSEEFAEVVRQMKKSFASVLDTLP